MSEGRRPTVKIARRSLLLGALGVGVAGLACGAPGPGAVSPSSRGVEAPPRRTPKKVLILGGTSFLGPEIVEVARARGHTLTLFNRGKTNPQLFPNIEKLHGDRRKSDLDALKGRTWDVVIDTSGYFPREVTESATLLRDAKQYVFISSISVYDAPPPGGVDESGAVGKLEDPSVEKIDGKTYGPLKAACERAAEAAMPEKVTVIRPGLIVGPRDPTDRFTYWPVRLDAGGEVIAPGGPSDPVQVIDVRDLAAWIVTVFEEGHVGVYNAVGPAKPMGMGELLDGMKSALGSAATLTWVDEAFLASQKVSPWSDMPVWMGSGEDVGMARVSSARAIAKGLTFRPLGDTARDTLEWWKGQSEERRAKPNGWISRDREREVLAGFKAQRRGG